MAVDRAVKMSLGISLDGTQAKQAASAFGGLFKAAIGAAATVGLGVAARSTEVRNAISGAFAGASESIKKSFGGFMGNLGVSAGTAGSVASGVGSVAGGVGRFAWNHPRLAGAALGGLGGGIPGMLSGAAPNFGRFLASSGGAAIGGAVAGPLGAVGGGLGGMLGGVGGAAAGIAIGGAAAGVVALGKAALEAADMLSGMVALTDPATAKEWQRAMADITAVLGDMFKPILEVAINQMRGWADLLASSGDGIKDVVSALSDVAKVAFDLFINILKPVLPIINIALKGLAAAVNVVLWPFKKLAEGIDWVISKIPFLGGSNKGASQDFAGSAAQFTSVDAVSRNVQQAAYSRGLVSKEDRMLAAMEETAKNTDRIRPPSRHQDLNDASLGGHR